MADLGQHWDRTPLNFWDRTVASGLENAGVAQIPHSYFEKLDQNGREAEFSKKWYDRPQQERRGRPPER